MESFSIYNITVIFGLVGFILIVLAFLTGKRIIKTPVKYHLHRKFGLFGFIAASLHAIVMIYFYLFS
jgi:DMSO/TMAO reductase YedYZ heme-binding membrane subunit